MSNDNEGHGVVKETVDVIKTNKSKKVKQIYKLKNKLIVFTYYLNFFFTHQITLSNILNLLNNLN